MTMNKYFCLETLTSGASSDSNLARPLIPMIVDDCVAVKMVYSNYRTVDSFFHNLGSMVESEDRMFQGVAGKKNRIVCFSMMICHIEETPAVRMFQKQRQKR